MSSLPEHTLRLSLASSSSSSSSLDERGDNPLVPASAGSDRRENPADLLLDATRDARQIIRLIQCPICQNILHHPTTLPCGHSICRSCVPKAHPRANISWPATASRLQGFDCPLPDCGKEHATADCALDITLNKIVTVIKTVLALNQSAMKHPGPSTHVTVRDRWGVTGIPSLEERQPESRVLSGGKILATYTLAELGNLEYSSELTYSSVDASEDDVGKQDAELFLELKKLARTEVDCQICYALFLDPMTTTCGHTYCRACIYRVLDHSGLCPVCRGAIHIQAGASAQSAPSNKRLVSMIDGFWADLVALRSQAYLQEVRTLCEGCDIPIFVCTLAFPSMPLFLHVFEPRYRLMIRRALAGNRTFGMVLGTLSAPGPGERHFLELGVLMRIVNIEFYADGRSLLETVGISRFRIKRHGWLDGYVVAKIEKVDDISLAEEEALESSEIRRESGSAAVPETQQGSAAGAEPSSTTTTARNLPATLSGEIFDSMSSRELVNFGVDFVGRMQAESVHWLTDRMLALYGECPADPATFPWWFACVFPVTDSEKYRLLGTLSVRERLKITCRWAVEWEARARRWSVASPAI
ncbi:ATP-dependent protease La domain-containing protein [Xylaria sp. CBS 124048]|nr:ATP-dependent protease La domain-containing protein [Xylaria sp. CBS 124048]